MRTLRAALAAGLFVTAGATGARAEVPDEGELAALDLEALMDLEVTTVSKRAQKLSQTPAAVFVISQEDIRRSGATTVPELLRMAPGVQVARIDASRWAISVRGFNDEYSNKLLVMIDGRSIYTPLFSGVVWNEHELMLEDVERIEVVRGPGGTMWGANAVNGVIHVITKQARDTQGLLVSSLAGNQETYTGAARWGGDAGDAVHYRVYGKFADRDEFQDTRFAGEANDAPRNVRAGGRLDWKSSENGLLTFQGDFNDGEAERTVAGALLDDEDEYTGGNVLTRYTHSFSDTSDASLQLYYDRIERDNLFLSEDRDTVDVDFRHSFAPLARNQVMWGGGYRLSADRIEGTTGLSFAGRRQKDNLYSLFVQDEIAVVQDLLSFTAGSKFEHNDYTGFEIQPSARLLATPHERHSLWASVSRAVRTPSRADEDIAIVQPAGGSTILNLTGSSSFDSEKVIAYELGYRMRPVDAFTLDLATFYNVYDDLRTSQTTSIVPAGPVTFVNQTFTNNLEGDGYGAEVAAQWALTDRLHLMGGYTFTRNDLSLKNASVDTSSLTNAENLSPRHQFRIATRLNLPWDFELDTSLAWVDRLAGTSIDAYTRLDVRVGWRVNQRLEVALVGQNLIEEHQEFQDSFLTAASDVPRSVYGSFRWHF